MAQLKGLDGNLVTGREIYCAPSITGLGRVPITILSSYVLAKASLISGIVPFSLEELAETLLVDGAYYTSVQPLTRENEKVCGVWAAARDSFTLRIGLEQAGVFMFDKKYMLREFARTATGWGITDYDLVNGSWQEGSKGSTPAENITYVYNPVCPVGVLSPAQVTYNRLEEIAVTIRRFQTGAGAKTLIIGNVRNKATATVSLADDTADYAYVGGSDISVDRMASTAAIDQLMTEFDKWLPLYYQDVHMVDTTSPIQRPSGSDRALVLGPMMRFVDALSPQVSRVLAVYGAEWQFERIHTTDVTDRAAQLDLLERQYALGVITLEQFNQRAGEL